MRARAFDLVVFDWDGTLCDSAAHIVRGLQQAVQSVGGALPSREQALHVIGLSLDEALQRIAVGVPARHLPDMVQAYRDYYQRHMAETAFFDGVPAMLQALRQQGRLLAVATGKSRWGLDAALRQLNAVHCFDATRTADQTAGKPDPLMLREIMDELGVAAQRTLMVGDTTHDLQMAHNAATPSVAVSYGAHSAAALQSFAPLYTARSLGALQDWLLAS